MKITYSPGSNTDVIEVTQTETLLDGRTRGISASDGKPPQLVDVDVCVCVCVCVCVRARFVPVCAHSQAARFQSRSPWMQYADRGVAQCGQSYT